MPVTTGMKPHGYYDQHSAPQLQSIYAVLPWLLDAIATMNFEDSQGPVVVADFGASQGRNSVAAMQHAVAALRARTNRPVQIVLSDLATNDFNQLFANLMPGGTSAFTAPGVYAAAVGGSMYDQLMPSGTVTIAMTFNALGYLSRRPREAIPDYILPMGPGRPRPGASVPAEARRAYAELAAADLQNFYRARAASMVPGGKLLAASFGVGKRHRCCDGIYDVLNDAMMDVVKAGRASREDYERLVFPVYFRSLEELTAPVSGPSAGLSHLFKLERAESMEVPVPFIMDYERSKDLDAYANGYTAFLRAFTEPMVRLSLMPRPGVDDVLDFLYERVRARLKESREDYLFHYIQVAALLTRL